MGQKKKLEAGLDDLFSQRGSGDSNNTTPVTPDLEQAPELVEERPGESATSAAARVEETQVTAEIVEQDTTSSDDLAAVEDRLTDMDIEIEKIVDDEIAPKHPEAIVDRPNRKRAKKPVKQPAERPEKPPDEFEIEDRLQRQLVIFTIAGEDYGLDVHIVDSIIKIQPITVVPNTPDYVEGVTNLRGEVLPVVDLRRRLGLPLQEPTKDTRIIVTELPDAKIGLLVDAMVEVLRVAEKDIQPPSPLVSTVKTAFINGIVNVGGLEAEAVDHRLIVLLNLVEVLSTGHR